MNITDLTSNFTDYLRPNVYLVYIFPKKKFADFENLGFICHESSFPFYTFNTTDVTYNNRTHSHVNKIDYDPITLTFFVDKFNKTFKFFDAWRKEIIDDNFQFGFYDDYISQIEIELIDGAGDTAAIATLLDAYPININPISLSFAENDAIMSMQVSFKFNEIAYNYIDRPKQVRQIISGLKSWKDLLTLGNARKGINMITKLKNYRHIIENGNVYDIATAAGKVFSIAKGARPEPPLSGAVNIFNNVKNSKSTFDAAQKASKLF